MDELTSALIILVLILNVYSELVQKNTGILCPSVCKCNGNTTTCEGHDGSHLEYIPQLPENTTHLVFRHNHLGYLQKGVFKNVSILYLINLDLSSNRINKIDKMAFQMLPNLQFLDLSENKGLHSSKKLHSAFLGLQRNPLNKITLE